MVAILELVTKVFGMYLDIDPSKSEILGDIDPSKSEILGDIGSSESESESE